MKKQKADNYFLEHSRSEKKRHYKRMCGIKIAYKTVEEARSRAQEFNSTIVFVTPVNAYYCASGNHYHIGHSRRGLQ